MPLEITVRDSDDGKVRMELSDSSDLVKVVGLLVVSAFIVANQAVDSVDQGPKQEKP